MQSNSGIPLGCFFTFQNGKAIPKDAGIQSGVVPAYGSNGLIGYVTTPLHKPPFIVIGRVGACGEIHIIEVPAWVSDNAIAVLPKSGADIHYFYHLLQWLDLRSMITGTAQPLITQSGLAKLNVVVPDLNEQSAIAHILDSMDSTIEAAKTAIGKAQRVRTAVISEFFRTGVGTAISADKASSYAATGWRLVRTSELLDSEPANGVSPVASPQPPGYPTFSIAAVRDGSIDLSGNHLKYVQLSELAAKRYAVRTGDLLIVRGNANADLVGRCGMVGEHPQGCIYPDILKRVIFRHDAEGVVPEYACIAWNHPLIHNQMLKLAKTSNGTLKVNSQDIKRTIMPVPPRADQIAFLEKIKAADNVTSALKRKLDAALRLKRGLMQDLLTGTVRTIKPEDTTQPAAGREPVGTGR